MYVLYIILYILYVICIVYMRDYREVQFSLEEKTIKMLKSDVLFEFVSEEQFF